MSSGSTPTGAATLWSAGPFLFANGVAVAPDQSAVYVAETWSRRITRIPLLSDGAAGEPELAAELPGMLPDGLGFGPDDLLYVACYQPSQIVRIDAAGTPAVLIRDDDAIVLAHPTNIAFRGSTAFCANLGRWHITAIELGAGEERTSRRPGWRAFRSARPPPRRHRRTRVRPSACGTRRRRRACR